MRLKPYQLNNCTEVCHMPIRKYIQKLINFPILETEYFTAERGCMIEMRARALIESKCDKLALNFITEALRAIHMCTHDHLLRRTVSLLQHQSLFELYFSLLYKFKESSRLKTELEAMKVDAVKEFIVNSFATIDANEATNPALKSQTPNATKKCKKPTCTTRLHKYHVSVTQYALQYILVRVLSGEYGTSDLETVFIALLTEWIRRNKPKDNFYELFRKLIQTAYSSEVIYDCCRVLYEMVRSSKCSNLNDNNLHSHISINCSITVSKSMRNRVAHFLFRVNKGY